ncbi:MAG: hypothetical protein AW10_01797 [Candidatus Accumulibacter appositus]|uniref:Uncharacterized protein n=1 Tax=Candidatus Accumulibacter appositus TaxID=1454003 RepID=A0A011PU07_9PROT|nr:MAG: hypothetical protein AW10_01797 [Candidatus Accumulibacter appositus]
MTRAYPIRVRPTLGVLVVQPLFLTGQVFAPSSE